MQPLLLEELLGIHLETFTFHIPIKSLFRAMIPELLEELEDELLELVTISPELLEDELEELEETSPELLEVVDVEPELLEEVESCVCPITLLLLILDKIRKQLMSTTNSKKILIFMFFMIFTSLLFRLNYSLAKRT